MPTSAATTALSADRAIDDAGWLVCTAAAHDIDIDLLHAVADGHRSTLHLPETVAAALLERTKNRELVDPDDQRNSVTAAVGEFAPDLVPDEPVDPAAIAAAIASELAGDPTAATDLVNQLRLVLFRLGRAADCAASGVGDDVFADAVLDLCAAGDGIAEFDTTTFAANYVIAATSLLGRKTSTALAFTARLERMTDITRAAFVAALAISTPERLATYANRDMIAAAWTAAFAAPTPIDPALVSLDPTDALRVGKHLDALATAYVAAGAPLHGPTSLAELWGLDTNIDTDAAKRLIDIAEKANTEGAAAATVDFLNTWTQHGALTRPLPGRPMYLPTQLDGLTWRTAFAIVATPAPTQRKQLCAAVTAWCARQPDAAADIVDALGGGRPELHAIVLEELPGAMRWNRELPTELDELIAASMNTVGLAVWITDCGAARRTLLSAAAGIGESRWRTLIAILDTFHGTPTEAVALTAELAPAT